MSWEDKQNPTSNSSYEKNIPKIAPAVSGSSGLSSCSSWSAARARASPEAFGPCCGYCHTWTKCDDTVSRGRGDASWPLCRAAASRLPPL